MWTGHANGSQLTFPSGVLFSTQISSVGFKVGFPDVGTGGIPGGNSIPGGGGRFPMGGGRNGGLCREGVENQHLTFQRSRRERGLGMKISPKESSDPTKCDLIRYRKVATRISS